MQLAEYHVNNSNIEKSFKNAAYFCQFFSVFVHMKKLVIS